MVFDLIFIAVSLIGIGILAAAVFGKNKIGLGILDGTLILLLVLIFLIFPMIFGAGMKEILFTWGPWSMTGGRIQLEPRGERGYIELVPVRKK